MPMDGHDGPQWERAVTASRKMAARFGGAGGGVGQVYDEDAPFSVVQEYLRLVVIRVQEKMPIFTNKWLWAAVSMSLLLQIVVIYTPIGSTAFGTVPLGPEHWGILLAGLVVGFASTIATGSLVVRRFGPL